jgi:hypothetical protein
MKKGILSELIRYGSWGLIVFILVGIAKIHPEFLKAAQRFQIEKYYLYRTIFTFATLLIGVLLEQERLRLGFSRGFKIRWIDFVMSIAIIAILLIPHEMGMRLTGIGMSYTIMQHGLFRSILGICCGVLLVQSITDNRV